jgi:hypothetical protein
VTLAAQQRALVAAIADGAEAPGLLRPPARLAIYRHACRARLAEALADNHPVLHAVLGDAGFDALAQAYVQARPSRRASIRWFGDGLAAFMRGRDDLLPHASLADLAAMEWALRGAFDAADASPLTAAGLLRVPPGDWPALRFAAHPSATLLPLAWAVEPLWQALSADPQAEVAPPAALAHTLLVWRQEAQTHWRSLDADEAPLLAACVAGEAFASLCARAAQAVGADAAAARVAGLLRAWVEAGVLVARRPGRDAARR